MCGYTKWLGKQDIHATVWLTVVQAVTVVNSRPRLIFAIEYWGQECQKDSLSQDYLRQVGLPWQTGYTCSCLVQQRTDTNSGQ